MRKRRSIVFKVLLILAIVPLLLFGFIQTPPGKAMLASGLSSALSSGEQTITIDTITGWIPGKVTVQKLEVGDAEGVWITASDLHCRWMIRELFNERIRLKKLSAGEIIWHRFPKSGKQDAVRSQRSDGFQLLEFRLDGLSINSLKLEKGVAGLPLEYAVHSGGIKYLTTGHLEGELEVSGDAKGWVELEAELTGQETDQLQVKANLDEMVRPTFGLDYLAGKAEASINAKGVTAILALDLVHAGQEGRLSSRLRFQDRMLNLQQVQYASSDYALQGDVALSFSKGSIGVALDSTFIDVQTNRYDLRGIAQVVSSNRQWGVNLEKLEVKARDSVSFNLAGTVDANQVNLSGTLAEMDVGAFPMSGSSNFTGRVNGSIAVTGSLEAPSVEAEVTVRGLASVQDALDELPELDFRVQSGIGAGRLFAETSITNYTRGHLDTAVEMPCTFSLLPLKFKPEPAALSAEVDADLDLAIFNRLAVFQNELIGGQLQSKVKVEHRKPSGYLRIHQGRYEHFDLGVVFRDFNADFEATDEGFNVVRASASGSGDGSVTMTGGFDRRGLGLQLDFNNAWFLQRDEVEAQISGELTVEGSIFRPDVAGALTIDRAEILLDNIARKPPPVLTDYDRSETNRVVHVKRKERSVYPVGLDITLDLPDQIFVNASMIEAVLGGKLHLVDTPRGVSVRGIIEPRRGFVSFIGKKFRFTEGQIVLDGSIPNVATLDNLTAEYSRRDVTARLILNGPANDPRFRLESTPAMPEDEVLSHVLFNRDTHSISPWQAVQIATAARQLSGGLSGPGFMYQIRRAIGVDTLEWREAEAAGEASSVAAGKYLTSGLYVEVNQTLDSQSEMGFTAELELTRHFSVETYTGPQMRPGIGVNWRNDY